MERVNEGRGGVSRSRRREACCRVRETETEGRERQRRQVIASRTGRASRGSRGTCCVRVGCGGGGASERLARVESARGCSGGALRLVSFRRVASRRVSRWRAVVVEVCALAGGCEARAPDSSTSELDSVWFDSTRPSSARWFVRLNEGARAYIRSSFVRAGVRRARCCCCLRRGAVRHDDGEGYCEWKTRPWLVG